MDTVCFINVKLTVGRYLLPLPRARRTLMLCFVYRFFVRIVKNMVRQNIGCLKNVKGQLLASLSYYLDNCPLSGHTNVWILKRVPCMELCLVCNPICSLKLRN